jgi:hypothetical protein
VLRRLFIGCVAIAVVLVTATAVAARTADASDLARATEDSDVELVDGTGTVVVRMRGALIGAVATGRVEIRDLPGGPDTQVLVLGDESPLAVDENTTVYEGTNLRFRVARGRWQVKITGSGIFTSIAGAGTVRLEGEGQYSVAGGAPLPWPSDSKIVRVGAL